MRKLSAASSTPLLPSMISSSGGSAGLAVIEHESAGRHVLEMGIEAGHIGGVGLGELCWPAIGGHAVFAEAVEIEQLRRRDGLQEW